MHTYAPSLPRVHHLALVRAVDVGLDGGRDREWRQAESVVRVVLQQLLALVRPPYKGREIGSVTRSGDEERMRYSHLFAHPAGDVISGRSLGVGMKSLGG